MAGCPRNWRVTDGMNPEKTPGRRFGWMRLRFPRPDPFRKPLVYWLFWLFSRWTTCLFFQRREAGWENIPKEGPMILAGNHASYMDPPLIGASCPRALSYLGRESLFTSPTFCWWLHAVGSVAVDRDGTSGKGLKTILARLGQGEGIILFPEGTRTSDGRMQPGRAGIGLIALKSGAPVVPVRVFGTFEAWGRHRRLPRLSPVAVRFGPPLRFEALAAEAETATRVRVKEIYQEVTDQILAAIARLERP